MSKVTIDNPNYEHEQKRLSRVIRELWAAPDGDKYLAYKADEQWEKTHPEHEGGDDDE